MAQSPVFHGKPKHLNIKLFFIREMQKNGDASFLYCKNEEQQACIFTKPLPSNKFNFSCITLEFAGLKAKGVTKMHNNCNSLNSL